MSRLTTTCHGSSLLLSLFVCFSFSLVLVGAATSTWAVEMKSGTDAQAFALEHGLRYIGTVAGKFAIFEAREDGRSNMNFLAAESVVTAEKQVARRRYTRSHPRTPRIKDALYASQWHLHRVQAAGAWGEKITGKSVTIGIVDDGLEWRHPDLRANYDATLSWDYNYRRADPAPEADQGHGTSAAGVAAAGCYNGHCGCGVAPEAKLAGIRLIAKNVYDYVEGQGLSHKRDHIKIYSCSWGPADSGTDLAGPGRVALEVLKQGFERHGSIFLWAGGNGASNRDNVNYDGYANSIYTLAIGAINNLDSKSWYSEPGACLFAVTPSSGNRKGIATTDLTGTGGYASGECTMQFGGTSSATPLAAGIVALLVQKHTVSRPASAITARHIQHIIAKGATKIRRGSPESDWSKPNARGYSHSHLYGFGLLVVPRLLAVPFPASLPSQRMLDSGYQRYRQGLPQTVQVRFPGKSLEFIEQVELHLSFYSNSRGQVGISLEKNGVTSKMALPRGDTHRGLTTWTYTSVRHWGDRQGAHDVWTVKVTCPPATGAQLRGVQLRLHGY